MRLSFNHVSAILNTSITWYDSTDCKYVVTNAFNKIEDDFIFKKKNNY
jgi:hypothetical protein